MAAKAVYKPVSIGNPAMTAQAIALGITTAAAVSPATKSNRSQLEGYPLNQPAVDKHFGSHPTGFFFLCS
jgi:hypothetical protein